MNPLTDEDQSQIADRFAEALTADDFSETLARYGEQVIPFLCEKLNSSLLAKEILLNLNSPFVDEAVEDYLRMNLKDWTWWNHPFGAIQDETMYYNRLSHLLGKRSPERLKALLTEFKRTGSLFVRRWAHEQLERLEQAQNAAVTPDKKAVPRWISRMVNATSLWKFFTNMIYLSARVCFGVTLFFMLWHALVQPRTPFLPHPFINGVAGVVWGVAFVAALLSLISCLILGMAVTLTRTIAKPQQTALIAIESRQSLQDLPVLALMTRQNDFANDLILERLKLFDPQNPPSFTAEGLSALNALLQKSEGVLLMPLFDLLGACGNEQTLAKLRAYANTESHPLELRQAAAQATEVLRQRLAQLQEKRVLLRAGEDAPIQEDLLRAPQPSNELPAEQLLRSKSETQP